MSFANPYSLPDFFKAGQEGRDAANAEYKQSALRNFLQPARQGDANATQALFKAGAVEEATQAQTFAAQQQKATQDALKDQLAQTSKLMLQGGDPMAAQLYPQWREMVLKAIPNLQLPEAYEPGAMQAVRAFAGEKDDTPSDIRSLQMLQQNPDLMALYERKARADWGKPVWDSARGGFALPPDMNGGAPAAPMPAPTTGAGPAVTGDALRDAQEWFESRGNPNAVSPKGARGRMQVMPGTARDPGFGVAPARDNSDAELTRVGNELSAKWREKYGDIGGIAAYNWGPGNWEAALNASGGDVNRALSRAPAETQAYVRNVIGRAQGAPQRAPQGVSAGAGFIPVPGVKPKQKEQPETFAPLSPAEIRAMGLPAGTVAQRSTRTGKVDVINKPDAKSGRQLPVQALKVDLEIEDAIGGAASAFSIIEKHANRLRDKKLTLGPVQSAGAAVRTRLGSANPLDVNLTEYKADLQKMVNDSLRLNKGVQTEGDAERAAREVMAANDNLTAARALHRLAEINKRGLDLQKRKRAMLRQNYGNGAAPASPSRPAAASRNNDPLGLR